MTWCSRPGHDYACLTLLYLLLLSQQGFAHGGVAFSEDEVCIIQIGFLQAHFTGYQPLTHGSEEFCEDIPEVARSVFVIDYLHEFLKEMPVDFRIIRDVNNFGIYASWEDIATIADLDGDTVFYQPSTIQPNGVYTVEYNFQEPGSYIGIVTAKHPTSGKTYRSVFHFQVGGTDYKYAPLFLVLLALVQLIYWIGNGGLARFSKRTPD